MKKFILTLFILIPAGLAAQQSGMDKLMEKYGEQKGVTVLNLSGTMLNSISDYLSEYLSDDYDYDDWSDEVTAACGCNVGEECSCDDGCICEWLYEDVEEAEIAEEVEEVEGVEEITISFVTEDGDWSDITSIVEEDEIEEIEEDTDSIEDYLKGIKSFKMIVNEKSSKKFIKDMESVVSSGGYTKVLSMKDDTDDIRIYMIETDESGNSDLIVVVGDKKEYIVMNIVGNESMLKLIESLSKYIM